MKKLKTYLIIGTLLLIIGSLFYKIIERAFTNFLLQHDPQYTKAVIVNERNYAPNDPVKPAFTYSYMFIIDGKTYKNNSHNSNLKIGDSIEIEYVKKWPSLNKPLHPTE